MYLLHSVKIPKTYLKKIKEAIPRLGLIALQNSDQVYDSIASHPDIFFFEVDKKTIIYADTVHRKIINKLSRVGLSLIKAQKRPSGSYPETSLLNAVNTGTYVFHNVEHTDESIKIEAQKRNLKLIHVNQGYSRCSVIPLNNNSIITSDAGIAGKATREGLKVLLVSEAEILLPGERNGFIGGCSGIMHDGTVFFLGDITIHPNFKEIDLFIKNCGLGYRYIRSLALFDAGSLLFL
ncbi:MAG: hypothetical protein HQ579_03365 [Candidatus Omnitrophica bacterium]|nr:hypothetical protein [Candidatus Omnitrophota bacterium]